ncbi:ComEC/Rec2 family competence protein [Histidinibacterium aquaticum]|uniref:ComEC family competence protein n=1 Tax=Histidinibacterium aquaticum TaxID=2613962 RepID=A0A5J5GLU0_9RHOB|nr:ComEC/Rec2 family competence protein [Histidinibacterium aquaticum]KAA9009120.1 ComEC family competence protein [Histidinibacterium aquaticum]
MFAQGRLAEALQARRGQLFLWAPVLLGLGIGLYFALRWEPETPHYLGLGLGVALGVLGSRSGSAALVLPAAGVGLVAAGLLLAGARAHLVAEPVLGFRYYGPVEGRIVEIDRSASDAVRLTLDRVVLERMSPARTPARVRVSLHGRQDWIVPRPGQTVVLTGHLSPPSGPVEPGGFDFRRMAWFDRLGAVGYTRTPVLLLEPARGGAELWMARQRMALSVAVRERIGGEAGAFAAAVSTGDRSAMPAGTLDALRSANLAHLLAISGLHMGLLTGFVFALVRYGLALWPWLALRLDTKKIGAAAALAAGAAYLALSGGNVATERAFIMVGVMLVAVLADRRAVTLRSVAVAAVVVLVRRPEELTGPGFQMSFAATTALVAVFAALRGRTFGPRVLRAVAAVVLSSFVAGLATAPIAAAHFNQISHYGLVANVLSVPVMGSVVMPGAVLAACLAPVGLEGAGLWAMEAGLAWILRVAHTVSGWDGALSHVPTPGPAVLPLLAIGGLWVALARGPGRIAGALPLTAAFGLWAAAERPALLIAEGGGLVGVMTAEGRGLSKPRGDGFAAGVWLENDGTPVAQEIAYDRGVTKGAIASAGPVSVIHVTGKRALEGLAGCGGAGIVVTNVESGTERPCLVLDVSRLRETGSVAGYADEGRLVLRSASELTGARLWTRGAAAQALPALPAEGQ